MRALCKMATYLNWSQVLIRGASALGKIQLSEGIGLVSTFDL